MGSNIPLPALSIRPVEQPDPMRQYGQLLSLRSLLQQQQSKQQELQDQQATTEAMKNWDGKDYDALSKSVLQNGGSANAATAIQQHGLTIKKTVSDIAKQDSETGSKNLETFTKKFQFIGDQLAEAKDIPDGELHNWAVSKVDEFQQGGILNPPQAQQLAQQIQQTQDPAHLRGLIQQTAKSAAGAKYIGEQAKTEAETNKDIAQAGEANAVASQKQMESQWYKDHGMGAPGVPSEAVAMSDFLQKNPGKTPSDYPAWKAKQDAAATQPFKIQTAQVEAQTRMAMEGMAKPVYAFNPQTKQKDLMSQTEAIAKGLKVMTPVTGKEVSEDTMLINRLGDVHQKISEYQQALQKPIDARDQGNLAALLGTQGLKLGAFGTEIPMDRVNAALSKENLSGLSANARDQLVAYRNAREALTGYTRVLSGSGRSSDKTLELQEQTLPIPSITDPDFSKRSLDAFRQNLQVVGQGLPNIPGIKTPEQWDQENAQGQQRPFSRGNMKSLSLSSLLGQ